MLRSQYKCSHCQLSDTGDNFQFIRSSQASTACLADNSIRAKMAGQHLEQWCWQGALRPWQQTPPECYFAQRKPRVHSRGTTFRCARWNKWCRYILYILCSSWGAREQFVEIWRRESVNALRGSNGFCENETEHWTGCVQKVQTF